jgi:hypothetical protein
MKTGVQICPSSKIWTVGRLGVNTIENSTRWIQALEDIWTLKRASKGGGWRASFALIFVLPKYSTKSNRLHSGKCDDGEEDCDWPG